MAFQGLKKQEGKPTVDKKYRDRKPKENRRVPPKRTGVILNMDDGITKEPTMKPKQKR